MSDFGEAKKKNASVVNSANAKRVLGLLGLANHIGITQESIAGNGKTGECTRNAGTRTTLTVMANLFLENFHRHYE